MNPLPRNAAELRAHDDVIKWKHFPRYWPFVRGIHRSPVNSPHKGQWRGALIFSLTCPWINAWVNNREAGDLRRYQAHYDVTVMCMLAEHRRSARWSCWSLLNGWMDLWSYRHKLVKFVLSVVHSIHVLIHIKKIHGRSFLAIKCISSCFIKK